MEYVRGHFLSGMGWVMLGHPLLIVVTSEENPVATTSTRLTLFVVITAGDRMLMP